MKVVLFCLITLPLTMVVVCCAPKTVDVTNDRKKRNGDHTPLYKDALFTSPKTAYFQKNQTHYLRCTTWRFGERLSSVFWYRGETLVIRLSDQLENIRAERYQLMDDQSGLIIYNVTDDDGGLYDCRVVPTATKRERQGLVNVEILDSTFPADAVSMDSINMALLSQNVDRQNGGRIKCPHSTIDASATYWSLDKGEGVDTDIIGAEYSNEDTLVLDKYKGDYQIVNGGDLQILSLQRPHRRFWCHRFLNGMAVGLVNVTGVVLTNQERPIITGCEPPPGDGCQVNPDKDLQLKCSVLNVYPKVTLYWNDVSKCDTNFKEESLESFDDDAKTFNQTQLLTVKAGSFSDDCLPKFVCNAIGAAIPVQPFSAEVTLQVVSVLTNQERPIITGCEPLPGDGCQVNFNPDKDLQLKCSVLNVYPKVTLYWNDVSKCDTNFKEESLESFDDDAKLFNQYQQLTVKAGSFSDDCLPKFVCNATGAAIPLQPFGAEVALQVVSGATWIIFILLFLGLSLIIMLILVIRRRTFLRKIVRSPNVEANTMESDDSKYQSPTSTEKTEIEVEIEPEDKGCYFVTLQDERQTIKDKASQSEELKLVENDESQTLMPQTSQIQELNLDDHEHVEIHPSGSSSFFLRRMLTQAQNIVVNIHNHVINKTPTKRNRRKPKQKKDGKGGASYQTISVEAVPESSPSDQHNLEVEMHENSLTSPRQLNMADSTLQEGYEADETNLQDVSVIQETPDTRDDPQEHSDQQTSPKEVTCEPLQKVEPRHNINEANSEPHLTEDKANLQREDPSEISVTEDEAACPTDAFNGASSEIQTSTASDNTSSQKQNDVIQDENQQSKAPEQSPAAYGKIPPKRKKTHGKTPYQKSKNVQSEIKDSLKPKGVVNQAAGNSKHATGRDTGNVTDEETELRLTPDSGYSGSAHCGPDGNDDAVAPEESSEEQSAKPQVTQPALNNDFNTESSPTDPLLDPTVNPNSEDVQHPHKKDPTQQPESIMKQPSPHPNPFPNVTPQEPSSDNPSQKEQDAPPLSLPYNAQIQSDPYYPSPGSNTINRWLDDTPKAGIPEPSLQTSPQAPLADQDDAPKTGIPGSTLPSPQADQDGHVRAQRPVVSPQSDYCEPSPGVGPESNGSRYPDRFSSDDESMVSESGNEVADDTPHNGVSDDVGYDQQHETPSVEMDEGTADDISQASPPDIEMKEDEIVERPKRDPKERQSKTKDLLRKQNPLKIDNFVAQRLKNSTGY
ncbi:uncharacterized protein LOC117305285 isoform X2 [Asterias rubens]|uniref:uncharacterized protein LOC117305285 isoform X2 n=1 Tax=Asterias rubens TaxID=7604 RepID=UPI0014550D3F|nr:uncharacterized protein LOC117305285 isoform X2 [Asterias rubens]